MISKGHDAEVTDIFGDGKVGEVDLALFCE